MLVLNTTNWDQGSTVLHTDTCFLNTETQILKILPQSSYHMGEQQKIEIAQ